MSLILPGMQNSLFTHFLLEALRGACRTDGDGKVRVFDVFHYVSDKVPADAPTQHPIFKAHDLENNFPLALYQGGKKVSPPPTPSAPRPKILSGPARVTITRRLVDRWQELVTYYDIPYADHAKFPKGDEPRSILLWLEQRNLLNTLRDTFTFLRFDDLMEEVNRP